jgi:hypothetical protein
MAPVSRVLLAQVRWERWDRWGWYRLLVDGHIPWPAGDDNASNGTHDRIDQHHRQQTMPDVPCPSADQADNPRDKLDEVEPHRRRAEALPRPRAGGREGNAD